MLVATFGTAGEGVLLVDPLPETALAEAVRAVDWPLDHPANRRVLSSRRCWKAWRLVAERSHHPDEVPEERCRQAVHTLVWAA